VRFLSPGWIHETQYQLKPRVPVLKQIERPTDVYTQKLLILQRLGPSLGTVLDSSGWECGRHDWIRTNDLFRVKRPQNCNPLIPGASAAPKSTLRHRKSTLSTIVSTIKTQKEKVAEEVERGSCHKDHQDYGWRESYWFLARWILPATVLGFGTSLDDPILEHPFW